MHACSGSPQHQTAFRTHLHDITSNHINASGLISQPAASFRHSDLRGVGRLEKPRRCLLQSVNPTGAERELFHLNVRSRIRAVGQRLLSLRVNRIFYAAREICRLGGAWAECCIVEACHEAVLRMLTRNGPERGSQGLKRSLGQ